VRADRLCEYCLLHEDDTHFGHEVDHIISEKHGVSTRFERQALVVAGRYPVAVAWQRIREALPPPEGSAS
jgi:hypothetical protein